MPASQAILLATYRALSLLPASYLPSDLTIPPLIAASVPRPHVNGVQSVKALPHMPVVSTPASPLGSRAPSPSRNPPSPLPAINVPLFKYAWLALAGISTPADAAGFLDPHMTVALNLFPEQIKVTNGELFDRPVCFREGSEMAKLILLFADVNLLAAPALGMPNIKHVVAVVCGTGTVGRTISVGHAGGKGVRQLPLEDVAVSRGWGYMWVLPCSSNHKELRP